MISLRKQLLFLVIGPLVLLSICLTVIIGIHFKDRALLATTTKARGDLLTGEAIIDLLYPGSWEVRDGELYKGNVKINKNFLPVDKISDLTGDTVTIFHNNIRISTTVRNKNGDRVIGTPVSEKVATKVLKQGQEYLGEADVVGDYIQTTAYKPIRDARGEIVGMFYVGISKKLLDKLIYNSLSTIGLISFGLTLLVGIGAYYLLHRIVIGPIKLITEGTRDVVLGQGFQKVEVSTGNEIGDLAEHFNQMIEGMQRLATQINKTQLSSPNNQSNQNNPNNPNNFVDNQEFSAFEPLINIDLSSDHQHKNVGMKELEEYDDLPKGLNVSTLKQILNYLKSANCSMSAEEVGEGVQLTRVTARRYLEYLEKEGKVVLQLKYGTVGRPVKLYTCK